MSRLRSKTRRVFPQISNVWSSLASNSRMAAPFRITISRRNPPFTWSWDCEEVCKSLLRLWLARPSPWRLSPLTRLRTSKPRSRTRKAFPQISRGWSLLASNWKMAAPFRITISRRNLPFTWSWDCEEVCKSLSRLWLARPSLWRLSPLTPLKTSKPRSRTRRVFPQISNVWSSLASNWRMAALFRIIISRRNPLCIWFSVSVVACKFLSKPWLARLSHLKSSLPTPLRT